RVLFRSRPFDLLWPVERSGGPERAEHGRVEQVELRMRCQRTPGAPREDRYPESKQEVFENLDVALHRLPFDLALARHGGNVEWRGVREADGLEEARERADVTDEPLELNFLAEVQRGIA